MLKETSDKEEVDMLKEESASLKAELPEMEEELKILLIPKDPNDEKDVIVEIRAAAGGDAFYQAAAVCVAGGRRLLGHVHAAAQGGKYDGMDLSWDDPTRCAVHVRCPTRAALGPYGLVAPGRPRMDSPRVLGPARVQTRVDPRECVVVRIIACERTMRIHSMRSTGWARPSNYHQRVWKAVCKSQQVTASSFTVPCYSMRISCTPHFFAKSAQLYTPDRDAHIHARWQ